MTTIFCVSANFTDCTITFAINGARWEYWLANTSVLNAVLHISRFSASKALVQAKRKAIRTSREIEPRQAH